MQAQACRIDPDARMNPILLKPHSNTGSQVIVMGRPVGSMDAREYFTAKRLLLAGRMQSIPIPWRMNMNSSAWKGPEAPEKSI